MGDVSVHLHEQAIRAARSNELEPVVPDIQTARGVLVHVTDHVGGEQVLGLAHRRVATDDGKQTGYKLFVWGQWATGDGRKGERFQIE